jgi:single-strand DNA-binding protein
LQPDPATGGPKIWIRQDGSAGASFEVRADAVRFLSSRDEMDAIRQSVGGSVGGDPFDNGGAAQEEDDIPF